MVRSLRGVFKVSSYIFLIHKVDQLGSASSISSLENIDKTLNDNFYCQNAIQQTQSSQFAHNLLLMIRERSHIMSAAEGGGG